MSFHTCEPVGVKQLQDAPAAFGFAQEETAPGIEMIGHIGRQLHITQVKVIFPTDLLLDGGRDRLLQRAHHSQVSRFHRKQIPVGLRLVLEHFVQGTMKLGD